jgi:hypothetical protein
LEEISALERVVEHLATLAAAETDPSKEDDLIREIGVLQNRIESDREQFS